MNKKLLTIAVAAAMAAPMAAMADATLYGKVRVAVEGYDDGATDIARMQNYGSRIGVKGSEELDGGLKAIYGLEFGVSLADTANEFAGSNPALTARNAFVGLAGDWGTLILGRHDTPLKISTGALDLFADTAGDNNMGYTEGLADRRANDAIAYITPSMGGLTIAAAVVPGENTGTADGLADAYSVAAMYSNAGFYASVAVEGGDADITALGGVGDLEQTRAGLGYKTDDWSVNAVWENVDIDNIGDYDTYVVAGSYNFGNNTLKAKYFDMEDDHDGFAIGLDHNLSKRTQAYLIYVDSSFDNAADTTVWGVGLNHTF